MDNKNVFRAIVLDDSFTEPHQQIKSSSPHFSYEIDQVAQKQLLLTYLKQAAKNGQPYSLTILCTPRKDALTTVANIVALDEKMPIVIGLNDNEELTKKSLNFPNKILTLKKPLDITALCELISIVGINSLGMPKMDDSDDHAKELVKSTFETSKDGILVTDIHGDIVEYNQKFVSMWQVPGSILKRKKEVILLRYMQDRIKNSKEFLSNIRTHHAHPESITMNLIKLENGSIFECYLQAQKFQKKTIGRIFTFRDVTKEIFLENKLHHQTTHDALTQLPNRVFLEESIKQTLRTKDHAGFAILFLDLDRFKIINDSLGYKIGDEILQVTAKRLQSIIRAEDILVRLGGDEFALFLNGVGDQASISARAQDFLNVFHRPYKIFDRIITVSASIGICVAPQDGNEADILLQNASTALHSAKDRGINNFQFYHSEMNTQNLELLDQEILLRDAITKGELELVYQPQFNLTDDTIVGAEALLRWNHPQRGILLPKDFLPLAEESGLIAPIGEWAMNTACAQVKSWQKYLPTLRVGVNITSRQLVQQNIADLANIILKMTKLEPEYLELELPESILKQSNEIASVLASIKALGIGLTIDDFGLGYSNLKELQKIHIDKVKIDQSFIQHMDELKDDEIIIRGIIEMAKYLNIKLLAKGVETQAQVDFLRKHKCEEVQGFYFSKPLTTQQFEALIKDHTPQTYLNYLAGDFSNPSD